MDLVGGWNQLWSAITGGGNIGVVLAIIGVAMIVVSIVMWIIKKRGGGSGGGAMGGFPWLPVVGGAILAGPTLTIPLILSIVQAIMQIVIALFTMIVGLF